jgi:TatD DNase family protein
VNVKATVGVHPCEVVDGQCTIDTYIHDIARLEELYISNPDHIVGIGECGIDTYYPGSEDTLVDQQTVFAAQCDLAKKYSLPIVIHSRANRDATRAVMQQYPDLTRYMHCWTYTPSELDVLIQSGYDFYI